MVIALSCGCAASRSVSNRAIDSAHEPAFLSVSDDIDEIRIEDLTFSNRDDVSRFKQVCRNAHWAPFVATLPGQIETVEFFASGVKKHSLLYGGGWLFYKSGDSVRFGTIHVDDGEWVEENLDAKLVYRRQLLQAAESQRNAAIEAGERGSTTNN